MGVVKWRLLVPAACLGVLMAGMMLFMVDVATVRLPRFENALFDAVRVATGDVVRLWYRHSVEKTAVEGLFTVGAGPVLLAHQTRMTSVGTGLPNTRVGKTHQEGEWLVVDEEMASVPGFDFFISPVNETRLTVNETAIAVETLAAGSLIRIDVERVRLLRWLLWRYGNNPWQKDQQ